VGGHEREAVALCVLNAAGVVVTPETGSLSPHAQPTSKVVANTEICMSANCA
jgi:hypothetical protein